MIIRCSKCDAENPAGNLLCKNCGEELYKYKSSVTVESAELKSKIGKGIVRVGWVVVIISLMILITSIICIEYIGNRIENISKEIETGGSPEELEHYTSQLKDLADQAKIIGRMFQWSIVGCLIGILIIIKQMHVRNME